MAELHALKPEDVDSLMKKMIDEVSELSLFQGGGAVVNPCCKNNPTSSRLWMLGVSITDRGQRHVGLGFICKGHLRTHQIL